MKDFLYPLKWDDIILVRSVPLPEVKSTLTNSFKYLNY